MASMFAFVVFLSSAGVFQPDDEIKYGISRNRTPPPVVSWSEFDRIHHGLTHGVVVGTFDAAEDLRSQRIREDGSLVEVSTWFNPDGSVVTLSFLNGYLVEIEESGLLRP